MNYDIIPVMDHYEAYLNGKFICSGDNKRETEMEVQEYLKEIMEVN